jgi:hypothetical protein
MKFVAVLLGLALVSDVAAQGQKSRPASDADFTGYWRIVLIPNEVHGSPYKNEQMGYADPCQFLVHKADGTWFNITISVLAGEEESKRQCPTKQAGVDSAMFMQTQSPFRWHKAIPNQDGLFFIRDTSPQTDPKKPVALLWKADYLLDDVPNMGWKKGDLLMQITQRRGNNIAPIWPMILRPVEQ